uniref:Sesquiterpene synthase TPS3 n=1 Tax=Xanthium strumarium TaxID=318068 RepID=TPS3_XANST|nr:RecName: Full=Sesquiterpene synthase TPS3; AltName: Full=Germacrene A synthase; AltName: Full=Terpene synthase 3; Short=XsTPS3 [Xanthium strumarium]AJT60315.1 germacrene A synthase [Xanthium strumarium]
MAAVGANATLLTNTKSTVEPVRPLANFPPSVWGDMFLSFSLDNSKMEEYAKAMEKPKQEVRRLILDPTMDSNKKLSLIYVVHRLGLTYMFLKEIEGQLDRLFEEFNLEDYVDVDLHTISINFQAFRHLGYKLPCDVFNKFKNNDSNAFKESIASDVRGLLGLYESAQLRVKGEKILDDASAFAETKLKSLVNTLEGSLAQQVKQALKRPFHQGMPMVEARLYFTNYQEEFSKYDSLLKLAKLHFNYLQLQQKEELRIVSKWWKDMRFQETTPYIRDRVPEIYLWILGLYFEPKYSLARIIATKITLFLVVLDDTYDAYGTLEELRLLTHAINRWDMRAMSDIPEYIRPFYKILLDEYAELEKQLAKEGRLKSVIASKEAFQDIARGYIEEAEWTNSGYVASFPEYMKNGLITSAYNVISKSALVGMGEVVSADALAWYESHPKILQASELISRLQDDVMTYQFERERGQSATGVDSYIKTYGVSEKEAIEELKKMIENAWKDINEGCLKPREVSMDLLAPILNLARMIDVVYRYDDGFTFPGKTLKEYITLLFVDSLPM